MLKSKSNYSLYDLCTFVISEQEVMYKNVGDWFFIWGLHMNIPLTGIHASGPPILYLTNGQLQRCLLNLLVKSHFKLFSVGKCIAPYSRS